MINLEPQNAFKQYIMNKSQKIFSYVVAIIMLCVLVGAMIVVAVYHLVVKEQVKNQKLEMNINIPQNVLNLQKQRQQEEEQEKQRQQEQERKKQKTINKLIKKRSEALQRKNQIKKSLDDKKNDEDDEEKDEMLKMQNELQEQENIIKECENTYGSIQDGTYQFSD